MTTKAQKIRVGAFLVVTAALLALVLVVFGGMRFWDRSHHYRIVFSTTVYGLEQGAHVFLNGMRVGKVESLRAAPEDLEKVEVKISIAANTPVHTDTRAILQFAGITGLKVIDLRDGSRDAPRLAVGGTIPEGFTTLDRLEQRALDVAAQSQELMERANQIVTNLVTITDPAKYEAMSTLLEQARVTATNLAQTSELLEAMVTENRVALRQSLAAVKQAATSTSALIDGQVATLLGGAGDLVADVRNVVRSNETQLRAAMFDLRQASRNFKELSREVRQRPSSLLFSKPTAERELP